MEIEAARLLGASFATFAMFGVALGIGKLFSSVSEAIGRNPTAKKDITLFAFVGGAMTEMMGLLAFAIAFLILSH